MREQSTHVDPGFVNWHGSLSIVQSSSLVSQFRPYQWKLQRHEYDPSTRDGSVGLEVESVHCPWFWHGIELQAGTPAGGPTGSDAGASEAASHV